MVKIKPKPKREHLELGERQIAESIQSELYARACLRRDCGVAEGPGVVAVNEGAVARPGGLNRADGSRHRMASIQSASNQHHMHGR